MARPPVQRRLAAILAADMVGYSRLMGFDEAGTAQRLREHQAAMAPIVADAGGRIFKTMGDGVMIEFPSVVAAVECALRIQALMAERSADTAPDRRMLYRIGVNLGDVLIEGDDMLGDGVNVAARLEALAEPGGIYLSEDAWRHVQGKVDITAEDIGPQKLKNIVRPVRVFRVAPTADGRGEPASTALPLPERPSIAVLPFQNMSGDPEQEYFSDGITADIITDLSKVSGLFVIARNSAFAYKGRTASIRDVCRELGVAHVLEGTVRKVANRVRVTTELIDGATGGHLWAERYDRELLDVFAVQDELTREIVAALKVRLTPDERARMGAGEIENIEAYDLVLRATEQHYRYTREGNAEAQPLIEQALAMTPDYARAHALLANNYLQVANNGWASDTGRMLDLAYEAACKAVALDSALALAHHAKGYVALWRRQFDEAIAEIDMAVKLGPNDAASHSIRAMILAWSGDPIEALRSVETAFRHDPLRSLSLFNAGLANYEAGHYEEALAILQRGVVRRPDFMPMFAYLAVTLVQLGRRDEARQAIVRLREINPAISQEWARRVTPYRDPAKLDRFVAALAEAGLPA
ncbi:MAG TPA: tetratricopeptide repeat protein [Alphaproteobacteria bacterium]|nr:tetratricopeptide repeat protein [Alphaproteobacteria bacterium]